jgi:hypothetical protein
LVIKEAHFGVKLGERTSKTFFECGGKDCRIISDNLFQPTGGLLIKEFYQARVNKPLGAQLRGR